MLFRRTRARIETIKDALDNDTINTASKVTAAGLVVYNAARYVRVKRVWINVLSDIAETGVHEVALKSGADLKLTIEKAVKPT